MIKFINIILIKIIKFYQYLISPLLGNNCRYFPSCSDYFIDCLKTYGPLKGSIKGVINGMQMACNLTINESSENKSDLFSKITLIKYEILRFLLIVLKNKNNVIEKKVINAKELKIIFFEILILKYIRYFKNDLKKTNNNDPNKDKRIIPKAMSICPLKDNNDKIKQMPKKIGKFVISDFPLLINNLIKIKRNP